MFLLPRFRRLHYFSCFAHVQWCYDFHLQLPFYFGSCACVTLGCIVLKYAVCNVCMYFDVCLLGCFFACLFACFVSLLASVACLSCFEAGCWCCQGGDSLVWNSRQVHSGRDVFRPFVAEVFLYVPKFFGTFGAVGFSSKYICLSGGLSVSFWLLGFSPVVTVWCVCCGHLCCILVGFLYDVQPTVLSVAIRFGLFGVCMERSTCVVWRSRLWKLQVICWFACCFVWVWCFVFEWCLCSM